MVRRYLHALAGAAQLLREVGFLRALIPLLAVCGTAALIYYGVEGLTADTTQVLGRAPGQGVPTGETYDGGAAVFAGLAYFALALVIAATLGPLSFFLWFGGKEPQR